MRERPATRTQSAGTTRSRPRRRATPAKPVEVSADTLERLLAGDQELSAAELAARTGAEASRVLARLRELETAGTVRRVGERRATRWRLVTDQERIEARAAELEQASRRRTRLPVDVSLARRLSLCPLSGGDMDTAPGCRDISAQSWAPVMS